LTISVGAPEWLASYDAFAAHIRDAISDEPPTRRGGAFSRLAAVLLPSTEAGRGFTEIEQNPKKSHDEGVDALSGLDQDGRQLVIQSKLTLDEKKSLDSILSYFYQFEATPTGGDSDALFDASLFAPDRSKVRYVIVSLSRTAAVVKNYENANLSTRDFYRALKLEGRLAIVDGEELRRAARSEYSRAFVTPSSFDLHSEQGWLKQGNVRIGIVAARELVDLYREYGDGLFYENIRSFLGLDRNADRETVNRRILTTVRESPEELLARNNGITVRASTVTDSEGHDDVHLVSPSIVNGCQTTMCLVQADEAAPAETAYVTVKIVESANAWEVTHSANYQNRVKQIDLDLARFMRPQLVEQVAASRGIALGAGNSKISSLLNEIAATRITYDEVSNLYRGLFSVRPNDLFDSNYNKLRSDVLDAFHETDGASERLFDQIFALGMAAAENLPDLRKKYSGEEYQVFERFTKASYAAYLSLLAASAATRINLDTDQPEAATRADFLERFMRSTTQLLADERSAFDRAFRYSYQALMETGLTLLGEGGSDQAVGQRLHAVITKTPFAQQYRKVLLRLDGD
jgi:hypothetical protein